jgi:hypothetical protein
MLRGHLVCHTQRDCTVVLGVPLLKEYLKVRWCVVLVLSHCVAWQAPRAKLVTSRISACITSQVYSVERSHVQDVKSNVQYVTSSSVTELSS